MHWKDDAAAAAGKADWLFVGVVFAAGVVMGAWSVLMVWLLAVKLG